jgi:hypothetical protein
MGEGRSDPYDKLTYDVLVNGFEAEDGTMGARRIRREQRADDMAESRRVNSKYKDKERVRRDDRMVGLLKLGKMPYTPAVLSWLSTRLDKPAGRISQDDVEQVLKDTPAKT